MTETIIDYENTFEVHIKSAVTRFKEFFEWTMKWIVWFYSDQRWRWMKDEEHTELQTLQTR